MNAEGDLVGIGIALAIVAAVLLVALSGGFDNARTAAFLHQLAAPIGSALHAMAGALGI